MGVRHLGRGRKKSFFRTTNLAAEPSDDACQVEPKVEVAKKEAQRCAGSTLQTPAEAPSLHARRTLAQTGARFQSCGLQGCGLQGCGLQGSGAHGSGLTPTGSLAQARHLRAHERERPPPSERVRRELRVMARGRRAIRVGAQQRLQVGLVVQVVQVDELERLRKQSTGGGDASCKWCKLTSWSSVSKRGGWGGANGRYGRECGRWEEHLVDALYLHVETPSCEQPALRGRGGVVGGERGGGVQGLGWG